MGTERDPSLHAGHRERMRERFLKVGIEGLEPHEILEMLLFWAIPRRDTNETAHLLLNKFGSLNGVFFAPIEELMEVPGINKGAATMLRFIGELFVAVLNENIPIPEAFDEYEKVSNYFKTKFFGIQKEMAYMLMLDNGLGFVDCVKVGEGTVNLCEVTTKEIVHRASDPKVSSVILAHNHPKGSSIPSSKDIDFTFGVNSLLDAIGVALIEHIVVGERETTPILQPMLGIDRHSPMYKKCDINFYGKFYGFNGNENGNK